MNVIKNLTDPLEILFALTKKLGKGPLTKLGKKHGYSRQYLSQTVHGSRSNPQVIQIFADELGEPVHGVEPDSLSCKEKAKAAGI